MSRCFVVVEGLESRRLLAASTLDTTFDGDGRLIHDGGLGSRVADVVVQPDGKTLAVMQLSASGDYQHYGVFRFNVNGSPDATFGGGDGVAPLPFTTQNNRLYDLTLQADGRIVVGGPSVAFSRYCVARYTASGELDTTLDGNGYFIIPNMPANTHTAVQSDGKILVGYGGGASVHVNRYLTDGTLDNQYGVAGYATVAWSDASNEAFVMDLAVAPSGKLLVTGLDGGGDGFVARVTTYGQPDSTFNGDGVFNDFLNDYYGTDIAPLSDDSFLVSGGYYPNGGPGSPTWGPPLIAKFTPSGTFDDTFGRVDGGGGYVQPSYRDFFSELVVDQSGKIVAVGSDAFGNFSVVQFHSNGDPDTSFAGNGGIRHEVSGYDQSTEIALAPDGKVVVGGYSNDLTRNALIRLNSQLGTVSGSIFQDTNADGTQNNGETTYTGFGVSAYLDLDNNGSYTQDEPIQYTGGTGKFSFTTPPGTYTVRLQGLGQMSLAQTAPANNAGITRTVAANQNSTATFGVSRAYLVSGRVFYDADRDGQFDTNESGYNNRIVYVDANNNGTLDTGELSTSTVNTTGYYSFRLPTGNYRLRQELPSGYVETGRSQVGGSSGSQFVQSGIIVVPEDVVAPVTPSFDFGSNVAQFPAQNPYPGTPFAIGTGSTVIQAEHFDFGGEGVAYHDNDPTNGGATSFRSGEAVDLKVISGSNYRVNNTFQGEWIEYTIDVAEAGQYTMDFRLGSKGSNGMFRAELRHPAAGTLVANLTGDVVVPRTGSNDAYTNVVRTVTLPAGTHALRLAMLVNSSYGSIANFDSITLAKLPDDPPPPPPPPPPGDATPYHGTPFTIGASPVTIQLEHFDKGGEGVGYHDNSAGNGGATSFRDEEDVDLKVLSGSNYRVNNTFAGEWMKYSVNVLADGQYDITFRLGGKGSGGTFGLDVPDAGTAGPVALIGSATVPQTGSNDDYTTLTRRVYLTAGQYSLRLNLLEDSSYGSIGNFDHMTITPVSTSNPGTPTEIASTAATYVRGGSSANTNFGNDDDLIVKTSPSGSEGNTRETYIKFDLSSLSAIVSARLQVSGRVNEGSSFVKVYSAANSSWSETGLTWNTKPSAGPQLGSISLSSTSNVTRQIDLTDFLQAEFAAGRKIVTLVFKADPSDTQAMFASDETPEGPKLLVS